MTSVSTDRREAELTDSHECVAEVTRAGSPGDREASNLHLPALDGIRAVAILMVVAYHSLNGLPGMTSSQRVLLRVTGQGWAGVDLFFVLSGFLITGILLDERDSPHCLRSFYARRVLRIVPVYVAFLLFSLLAAQSLGVLDAGEALQLHRTQAWYWTYSVNILVALHSWGAASFATAHLWSLSVEEQFYLLWPFAVLAVSPKALRRGAVGCIVVAELCRLAFALVGTDGAANFVLLPTRMDSLAAGAFLALAYRDEVLWPLVMRARVYVVGASVMLLSSVVLYRHTFDNQSPLEQLVGMPAITALATIAVATAVGGSGWLSASSMRFVGRISYGMYVWHLAVMRLILTRVQVPDNANPASWWQFYALMCLGTIVGSIGAATLSWYVVERPFLALKRFVPYA